RGGWPGSRRRAGGGIMTTAQSVSTDGAKAARILSLDVRSDGVAFVTYDVAGEAVNTLKGSFADEVARVFREIASHPKGKAVIVPGKPDGFIAGADIEMLKGATTSAQAEAMCREGHRAILRIVESPKPIVAAVHGAALGGGFEIALACQGRVLSDDHKTQLG